MCGWTRAGAPEKTGGMKKDLALVLGGGGATGHAWLIGVIAGLAEAAIDLPRTADLVIGTSAGATAAAQILGRLSPAELFAAVLGEQAPARGGHRPPPPPVPVETVFARMRAIGAAATSALELQREMGAFALESDPLLGPDAIERRRAMVAARLPNAEWPERPLLVTAVDAMTGELATFDRATGVDLVDALMASTAAPALAPTVEIGGSRYIDGGVRSVENADLATDYANVVVLSPFGGPRLAAPGQFEGLRREAAWRTDLASQVTYLRDLGRRVEVVTPDEEARAAMGVNAMDPALRIPAARAGFAQGKRETARLTGLGA